MSATRTIAWRFMMKGSPSGGFSPMTLFAWIAIAVGVAAMGSLLSVMYGFEGALKERVLKAYPHVVVHKKDHAPITGYASIEEAFAKAPHLKRFVRYLETEMIIQSDFRTLGAVIWGVSREEFDRMKLSLTTGDVPSSDSKLPQIMLGSVLGQRLGVSPGTHLRVISPIQTKGAMGLAPQSTLFEVSGLYSSGHYEFDQQYGFLLLEDAQDLLKVKDAVSGWQLWAPDLSESDVLQSEVNPVLPEGMMSDSWKVLNSALFQSLKLEQFAMFSILSLAVVIAVMNIGITLMMNVTHKRSHIGILRALGASQKQIRQIFITEGVCLGGVGLVAGGILTALVIFYLKYVSTFQLPEIYYDRSIPVEVRPLSLLAIYLVAVVLIYVSTVYPARKAALLDPVEAIRE